MKANMATITLHRVLHFGMLSALAFLLYGLVLSARPERYSFIELVRRQPATAAQLAPVRGDQAAPGPPRLTERDVPRLAMLNAEYARVFEQVMPAVVSIDTTAHAQAPVPSETEFREVEVNTPEGGIQMLRFPRLTDRDVFADIPGLGSGVIVSEDGYIITNHHVVLDADNILVTAHTNERYEAELVGADSTVDIAVLRIKSARGAKFPVLNFADSEAVRPGEIVFAFGNPFGLAESITQGVVNGTGRRFYSDLDNEYLQTDAVINPGNSGGPLTNIYGEVVGINVIVYSGQQPVGSQQLQVWQGVGLALPANRVLKAYADLMGLGHRVRPYLGVIFNDLNPDAAEAMGLENTDGALIYSVEPDSPAIDLVRPGDVVRRIGGESMESASDATRLLAARAPGERLELTVWREGQEEVIEVELGRFSDVNQIAKLPEVFDGSPDASALRRKLGLIMYELKPADRQESGFPADLGGIFLLTMSPESPLSGHLEQHDVIHEINGQAIWTEGQFYELLAEMPDLETNRVVLTRNRRRYYLELRAE